MVPVSSLSLVSPKQKFVYENEMFYVSQVLCGYFRVSLFPKVVIALVFRASSFVQLVLIELEFHLGPLGKYVLGEDRDKNWEKMK